MTLMDAHTAPDTRAAAIAGLRELADFLERHPQLPAPTYLNRVNVWFPETGAQDHALFDAAEHDDLPVIVDPGGAGVPDSIEVRFGALVAKALVGADRRAGEDR
jgi:hypothetical protein